ncbi:hypothetical protein V8E51_003727 [Hyaloscypha variabilis]
MHLSTSIIPPPVLPYLLLPTSPAIQPPPPRHSHTLVLETLPSPSITRPLPISSSRTSRPSPHTCSLQNLFCPRSLWRVMAWSRPHEDLPSTDDETDSTTDADTDTDSLFDGSDDDETDITSGADMNSSSEINDDSDDNASLFEDEVRHPPEHCLTIVANLNVQRLRH